jgi:uncharacterized membrane protein YphA (DoxX/SURF4 family)
MNHAVTLDPVIGSLIVGCFALLFVSAAVHKLHDLNQFAQVFAGYNIAPLVNRWRLSWLLPLLEILVAVGLLLPASRAAASVMAAALLVSYALAISVNLRAGHNAIACGCGGPDQRRPIAAWMVWRNLLLASLLGLTMLPWTVRQLEWMDAATVGFGLVAIGLLYSCAERLLGELGRSRDAGIRGTP